MRKHLIIADGGALSTVEHEDSIFADELARAVIARIAPDELPQFTLVAQTFHRASRRQRWRAARRNEPLGIGADGVVALLSVPTLYVSVKLADKLAQEAANEAATWLTKLVNRVFRRRVSSPRTWRPEHAELVAIREVAAKRARQLGLTDEQVDIIADGIVAELAIRAGNDT
jgi:hypothetical protein